MPSGPPLRISKEAHAIVEAMHRAKYPGDYPYSPTADGECLAAALDAALARERRLREALIDELWQHSAIRSPEADAIVDALAEGKPPEYPQI